jgi:alpha-beta hydrolase superfamily lysophospholipase
VNDWLIVALKVLAGGACLLVAAAYVVSLLITSYHTYSGEYLGAADLGIDAQPFAVVSDDGTVLRGVFAAGAPDMPVLVASHGIADCKEGVLPFMLPFVREGYGVAAWDMRHHNESGGRHCTLGYRECDDLCAVTAHVRANLAPGRPLFYWGFSLGATVSLLAAARSDGVCGIVAHCPFISMRGVASHYVSEFYHIPAWPLVPLALRCLEWRTGARASDVDVPAVADRLRDMPVLLFGSSDDRQVPIEWLETIAAAIGPSAKLVIGPYGHADGMIAEDEGLYDEGDIALTLDFLARHAAGPARPDTPNETDSNAGAAAKSAG